MTSEAMKMTTEQTFEYGVLQDWRDGSWGFLKPTTRQGEPIAGASDLFLHHSALEDESRRTLRPGARLTFSRGIGRDGRSGAVHACVVWTEDGNR
jgi:cold shock CspA family protein